MSDAGESAVEGDTTERPRDGPIPYDSEVGASVQTGQPERIETPETIDWHGWVLVFVVVVSFVIVPLFVLFLPEMHELIASLGFTMRQAYIAFPMIPAILLGLTAVWATLRSQSN